MDWLTCCSLSNGSQGNEQHQQLRAGEVQQAWGRPSGEEERRKDSHVNDHHCCQQHSQPEQHPAGMRRLLLDGQTGRLGRAKVAQKGGMRCHETHTFRAIGVMPSCNGGMQSMCTLSRHITTPGVTASPKLLLQPVWSNYASIPSPLAMHTRWGRQNTGQYRLLPPTQDRTTP